MNPCLEEIPNLGVVYDSNLARKIRCFEIPKLYDPLNGFGLKQAHISEDCSERAKKRRRKWPSHPDATPTELATRIKDAYAKLWCLMAKEPDFWFSKADFLPDVINDIQRSITDHCQNVICHPSALNPTDSIFFYGIESKSEDWIFERANTEFVIPAHARFWNGDLVGGQDLIGRLLIPPNGCKLCVVDPPWPSKSRGVKYQEMSLDDLLSIRVGNWLAPGALVAIWVTNDRKVIDFAKGRLMEAWGLENLACWYWIKPARQGRLVTPVESPHKKPFEPLLLARRCVGPAGSAGSVDAAVPTEGFLIFAPPGEHSRKPFLGPLLAPFVPRLVSAAGVGSGTRSGSSRAGDGHEEGRHGCRLGEALELFARELRDGWVSAGDQAHPRPHTLAGGIRVKTPPWPAASGDTMWGQALLFQDRRLFRSGPTSPAGPGS